MSEELKTDLAIVAGKAAHAFGVIATQKMLANISMALAQRTPDLEISPAKPVAATMREIVEAVAKETGFTVDELRGRKIYSLLNEARFECWARIYALGTVSYWQIGTYFDGRDHTTVRYGVLEANKARAELQARGFA